MLSFFFSSNNFLPSSVVVLLSEIPLHAFIYISFLSCSFFLSSFSTSFLAISVYLVMVPCLFMPGSSTRALTVEEEKKHFRSATKFKIKLTTECSLPLHIYMFPKVGRDFLKTNTVSSANTQLASVRLNTVSHNCLTLQHCVHFPYPCIRF